MNTNRSTHIIVESYSGFIMGEVSLPELAGKVKRLTVTFVPFQADDSGETSDQNMSAPGSLLSECQEERHEKE